MDMDSSEVIPGREGQVEAEDGIGKINSDGKTLN